MIRVDAGEQFPISVSLVDETTGMPGIGETVYYDIRDMNDNFLTPPASGILIESAVEAGIYNGTETINTAGKYVLYATCSGFVSGAEEIIVNPESMYDLTKQHNVSVEDVPRTNVGATLSQIARNVPMNRTDYIIHRIKRDSDPDWSTCTVSGMVYAHYRNITDDLPYMMGGPF